jgi:hypothetical protein
MQPEDRAMFAATLTAVADLYDRPLSENILSLWWESLKDASLGDFQDAMQAHVQDPERGRFMPRPADLIHQIEKSKGWLDRLLEWERVLAWARGEEDAPRVEIRHAVQMMGGIRRIKMAWDRDLPKLRDEFFEVYNPTWRKDPCRALEHDSKRSCSESRDGSVSAANTSKRSKKSPVA